MRHRGYIGESFVVWHQPEVQSGASVVILPPLGYEDTAAYRPLRVLADRLCAVGHTVLRMDWPGLGDSGGEASEALVERWIAAGRAVRASVTGPVIGLGVRGGALLARVIGFDALVLWGLPPSGKALLREERAFHAMAARMFGSGAPVSGVPEGGLEAGGFWYSAATVEALTNLTLPRFAGPTLVLGRDGVLPKAEVLSAFDTLTTDPGVGLASLLDDPYASSIAEPTLTTVIAAIRGFQASAVTAAPKLQPTLSGPGWVERPWVIAGEHGELSGIICAPSGRASPKGLCTVFFNAGGVRRSGPNRLWTTIARALAAKGQSSLRLDVRDVGDSDGVAKPHADLNAMYSQVSVGDAVIAVDWASQQAEGVAVVGLCSGGFLALQAAARRPVRRAVIINTLVFVWDEDAQSGGLTSQITRSLLDRRRWGRLLSGKIDALALGRAMVTRARLGLGSTAARLRGEPQPSPAAELLRRVRANGAEVVFVASEGDASVDYLQRHVPEAERGGVITIPGVDHTIRPIAAHARLTEIVAGQR